MEVNIQLTNDTLRHLATSHDDGRQSRLRRSAGIPLLQPVAGLHVCKLRRVGRPVAQLLDLLVRHIDKAVKLEPTELERVGRQKAVRVNTGLIEGLSKLFEKLSVLHLLGYVVLP